MRDDMEKVFRERGKRGGKFRRNSPLRSIDLEDLPDKESVHARITDRRHGDVNTAPLNRYLQKQVGRPWNDVYSELCSQKRNDGTDNIRRWCKYLVELNVKIIDGAPYCLKYQARPLRSEELYVHPETGLLLRAPKEVEEIYEHPKEFVLVSEQKAIEVVGIRIPNLHPIKCYTLETGYKVIEGIWYFVKQWRVQDSTYRYKTSEIGVSKRQLNSKELRKLGLRNETNNLP